MQITGGKVTKRALIWIALAFLVTRLVLGFLAIRPQHYGEGNEALPHDVYSVYQGWAEGVIGGGLAPYSGVAIEYPPGALPFVLLPEAISPDNYQASFVMMMLLVDVAGILGLLSLARRGGSLLGPWIWIVGTLLLGPLAYVRLDLIPAVAAIWSFERAAAGRVRSSGALLGYAAFTKLYPALFLPALLTRSREKKTFLTGAAIAIGLPLLPLLGSLRQMFDSVVGYHLGRGVQIESVWGAGLLVAKLFGRPLAVEQSFGALHVAGAPPIIDKVAGVLTIGVVALSIWFVRRAKDVSQPHRADVAFVTLMLSLALATVLSPQFLVWAIAAAAVAACSNKTRVGFPAASVLLLAALTQWIFPFVYGGLLAAETDRFSLGVLVVRNVVLIYVALESVLCLLRAPPGVLGSPKGPVTRAFSSRAPDAE